MKTSGRVPDRRLDDSTESAGAGGAHRVRRLWQTGEATMRRHPLAVKMVIAWVTLAYLLANVARILPVRYGYDAPSAFFDAAALVFLVVFPFLPRLSTVTLTAVFLAYCCFVPSLRDIGCLWNAMMVAQAYIGYRMRPAIGAGVITVETALCVATYARMGGRGPSMLLLAIVVVSYAPGLCLRWRDNVIELHSTLTEKRLQAERADERAEAMRRDEEAAVRLHDALTGTLASVAMVAEMHEETAETADDRERFHELDEQALSTLRETRRIIDQLTGNPG